MSGGNERVRGCEQNRHGLFGGNHLRADKSSIDQQQQLRGQIVRTSDAEPFRDAFEPAVKFVFVRNCDNASGVIRLRKLRSHVQLRSTAIIFPAHPLADPLHVRIQFSLRVGAMALRDAIPLLPKLFVLSFEKRRDEVVLCSEVPVETGLGNARSFDDEVDADGARALPIKQLRRGF